jgi:hypothetical protein
VTIIETALKAVEDANDPDALYEAHEALYEAVAARRDRIASGLCVNEGPGVRKVCVTHACIADFDHYLSVSPSHSASGFATND